MAKKFKIAQATTFKETVFIPRVGAEPIEVKFEYKYLPRNKLAELFEKWRKEAEELEISEDMTLIELTDAEIDLQVTQLKDILVGWDFDDDFSDENIRALVEASTHASRVVLEKYHNAYSQVKLGN